MTESLFKEIIQNLFQKEYTSYKILEENNKVEILYYDGEVDCIKEVSDKPYEDIFSKYFMNKVVENIEKYSYCFKFWQLGRWYLEKEDFIEDVPEEAREFLEFLARSSDYDSVSYEVWYREIYCKEHPEKALLNYVNKCKMGALGSIIDPDGYTISEAGVLLNTLRKIIEA